MSARGLPPGVPAAAKERQTEASTRHHSAACTAPRRKMRGAHDAFASRASARALRARTGDGGRRHGAHVAAHCDGARHDAGSAAKARHAAERGTQRAVAGACAPPGRVSGRGARGAWLTHAARADVPAGQPAARDAERRSSAPLPALSSCGADTASGGMKATGAPARKACKIGILPPNAPTPPRPAPAPAGPPVARHGRSRASAQDLAVRRRGRLAQRALQALRNGARPAPHAAAPHAAARAAAARHALLFCASCRP